MNSHEQSDGHSIADGPQVDPVCGMQVAPEDAAGTFEHLGHTRNGFRTCFRGHNAPHRMDLPDASANRPLRARQLPNLRNGS
jgi:hypothetical protein